MSTANRSSEHPLERKPTDRASTKPRPIQSDRQIRNLNEQGAIEKIGRGLFSTATLDADPDLIEAAFRAERATICLASALARHGLTDEIPATIDVALPRGTRAPATSAPITWHKFDPKTFDLGRENLDVGAGYGIGLYSAERSICDAFRLRHLEGSEQAVEAAPAGSNVCCLSKLQKNASVPS